MLCFGMVGFLSISVALFFRLRFSFGFITRLLLLLGVMYGYFLISNWHLAFDLPR